MSDKKRHTMTHLEAIRVGDMLRQHCIAVDGVAVFEDNWSDQRVVDEIGTVTLTNVENLRKSMLGPLAKPDPVPTLESLSQRIKALEAWAAARPVERFVSKE